MRVRWGRVAFLLCGLAVLAVVVGVGDLVARAVATLPPIYGETNSVGTNSVIYDAQGQVVTTVPSADVRDPVPISAIPPMVQHAFVAIEDRWFYQDPAGVSVRGILRAAVADARGAPLQGASTITMELAKNLYLTPQDTLTRKIKQALLAVEMSRLYTKSQIMDMYLNEIYLGEHAYGIAAAAQAYFDETPAQLTVPQAALLAGLPQDPVGYDPFVHPRAALARRNVVLDVMAQQGYITAAQASTAKAAPLGLIKPGTNVANGKTDYPDPWFVDTVINQLEQTYHFTPAQVENGGLKIYTTLNPKVYAAAQQAVTSELNADFPLTVGGKAVADPMQAAVVVMDQSNGDVLAVIGGRQHNTLLALDRATSITQQTGSAIKPLAVYIPALEAGYTAGTTVQDTVHSYTVGPGQPPYLPTNDNPLYYGLTTFTEALRRSVNTVAVQVLNKVGVARGVGVAREMGLTTLDAQHNDNLSVALGATVDCCSPLEMVDAYATIANGGARVTPRFITKVVGPDGQVLLNNPPQLKQVLDPRIAYVMTTMLETVDSADVYNTPGGWDKNGPPNDSNWGTGYDASVHDNVPGWQMAAKTGTTNKDRQAWFMAYTPLYTVAVWVGEDQPKANPGLYGGTYAGPIAKATMEAAVAGHAPVDFPQPAGVVEAPIDIMAPAWQVAKPGPLTPAQYVRQHVWFVQGTQPTQTSAMWEQVKVTPTNPPTLWAPGCAGAYVDKTYLNAESAYTQKWAQGIAKAETAAKGSPQGWQQFMPILGDLAPPTATCPGALPPGSSSSTSSTGAPGTPGECTTNWRIRVGTTVPLSPSRICVPRGRTATLTFVSADGFFHVLHIAGYNVTVDVPATGGSSTVRLTMTYRDGVAITDPVTGRLAGQLVPGP